MTSLRKKLVMGLMTLMSLTQAYAGCEASYEKKIADLTGKMNPPRTTLFVNLGAEAALVSTLAMAGTVTLGSVVALPSVALAAGGYLGILSLQRKSYQQALRSLKQAQEREGKALAKFFKKVKRKNRLAGKETIRHALLRLNAEEAFCTEDDESGKVQLANFKKMVRLVAREI